jgi:hypothetical protein
VQVFLRQKHDYCLKKVSERSLMLANVNDYPVILQTWVDQGQGVQITLKFRLSLCRLFLK